MTQIPLDVIFPIVDLVAHFDDHWFSLKTCAIVCQDWAFVTRGHMFRRISVDASDGLESFVDVLRGPSKIGTLAEHVDFFLDNARESNLSELVPRLSDFIQMFPDALPNVQGLSIHDVRRRQCGNMDTKLLNYFAALTSITTLSVTSLSFTPGVLLTYISVIPNLERLSISWLDEDHSDTLPDNIPISRNPLQSIRLRNIQDLPMVFRDILTSDSKHSLRSVILGLGQFASIDVTDLLREIGPQLEYLDLKLYSFYDVGPVTYRGALDISSCERLKSLTLRPAFHGMIPRLVAQVSSRLLENLQFTVPDFRVSDLSQYRELARSVKELENSTLREIIFVFKTDALEMEKATRHFLDVFSGVGQGRQVSVVHNSTIDRWWKSHIVEPTARQSAPPSDVFLT